MLPLAILAGGWFFIHSKKADSPIPSLSQDSVPAEDSTLTKSDPLLPTEETDVATAIVNDIPTTTEAPAPVEPEHQTDSAVDVTTLAVDQRLTDEEFERLEALIRNDKGLRLELLEEFRYNSDPERAKQLAALLGPYNDPEIVQTASELVHSGDPNSKKAGLGLLSRIQPRSNEARDIAIDLLSAESDPDFLVSTMNVLATPARSANESQRQLLTDNLSNLSSHYDPSVNPDDYMIGGLLNIAEDTDVKKSTRYAALEALAQMNLRGIPNRRYNLAKRNVNRRIVSSGN